MSGEAVLLGELVFEGTEILVEGAVHAGVGIARTLHRKRTEAVARRCEEEKARIDAWIRFREEQKRQVAEFRAAEAALEAVERRVEGICLSEANAPSEESAVSQEKDYLAMGKSRLGREAVRERLGRLRKVFDDVPQDIQGGPNSPFARLAKQFDALWRTNETGKRIRAEELTECAQLVARTFGQLTKEYAARHDRRIERAQRIESLLDDVLTCEQLARDEDLEETASLKRRIILLLEAREVEEGQIDILAKRLDTIKQEIGQHTLEASYRATLCASIERNLGAMGYETIESFPEESRSEMRHARLRIPGGEQVDVACHRNGRVAFQMLHERAGNASGLSGEELATFRRQEQCWCQDLKQLVRRLVAEGFGYEIQFERAVPEQSVSIVVVETGDELMNAEREEEEDARSFEEPKHRAL